METFRVRTSHLCKDIHSKCYSKVKGLFRRELKPGKTPMSEGYHPEIDDTPLCTDEDSTTYRLVISCCI
jgi:hypothetical protein